jgi:hypothetical protein
MDMDTEKDLSELLDAIVWGHRIVEVALEDDTEKIFVFRPLTLEERNMGNYLHKSQLRNVTKRGIKNRKQLKGRAIKNGFWKNAYDNDLKTLRAELEQVVEMLKKEEETHMLDKHGRQKRQSPTVKFKRFSARVKSLTDTINRLEGNYAQHIEVPSAEHYAEYERGIYFLQCATLSFPEMQPVWVTLEALKEETDTTLVGQLIHLFYNEAIADEKDIRFLARSGYWRSKWLGSKKNRGVVTLFNREMYDLTVDQFGLVYWSQIYDSAFEAMEQPSDEVFEDDKLFDRWLDEQHQKRKQERKQSSFDRKIKHLVKDGNEVGFNVTGAYCEECTCGVKDANEMRGHDKRGNIHNPSCSYGVYIHYDPSKKSQKIEDIQSTNPESVRRLLGNEQKLLAKVGADGIEEQQLRGDKSRSVLGMGTTMYGAGEYAKGKQGRARPQ